MCLPIINNNAKSSLSKMQERGLHITRVDSDDQVETIFHQEICGYQSDRGPNGPSAKTKQFKLTASLLFPAAGFQINKFEMHPINVGRLL